MVGITMKNKRITLRISEPLREKIAKAVEYRSESKSAFVRRAILRELGRCSLLSEKKKRALGVDRDGN